MGVCRGLRWTGRPPRSQHVNHTLTLDAHFADFLQIFVAVGLLIVAMPSIDLAYTQLLGHEEALSRLVGAARRFILC